MEHIDDLEDTYIAAKRIEDIRSGRENTIPLNEIMKRHGMEIDSMKPPPFWKTSARRDLVGLWKYRVGDYRNGCSKRYLWKQ